MNLPSRFVIERFAQSLSVRQTRNTAYKLRWYILWYILSFIIALFLLNLLYTPSVHGQEKGPICAKESKFDSRLVSMELGDSGNYMPALFVSPTPTSTPIPTLIPSPPIPVITNNPSNIVSPKPDVSPDQVSGGSAAMENIFIRESGNDPARWNTSGCVGLGQDCNGQLIIQCPTLEYNCEVNYFTNYMQTHIDIDTGRPYGTWENAWSFWQAHSWW